jgi:hypothetical protein
MAVASNRALRASLDSLSSGDLNIGAARIAVRSAIGAGTDMLDRVYGALRDTVWRTVAAREASDDLGQWYDLQMHAASLARRADRTDLAERLTAFAELTAQTGRFADRQPLDDVLSRKHVADLLLALAARGGTARRALLVDATGLADANLSRILALLNVHGLLRRARSGKEAVISLTDQGRLAAARLGGASDAPVAVSHAWWDEVPFAVAIWASNGDPIGSNDAFRAIASRAGSVGASAIDHEAWTEWLQRTILEELPSGRPNARELQLTESLWVDYLEQRLTDGRRIVIISDISLQQARVAKLLKQFRASEQLIAKVRQDLAIAEARIAKEEARALAAEARAEESQRRLLTFNMAVEQLRGELVGGTASLGRRLRSCIEMLAPTARYYKRLNAVDHQIGAIKQAMLYFMAAPKSELQILPSPTAEVIDFTKMLRESVDIVESLHKTGATYKPSINIVEADDLPRVRASQEAVRAVIGQVMLAHVREASAKQFTVSSRLRGNTLVFLMVSEIPHTRVGEWTPETFINASSDEIIYSCGYGFSRDLATSVGGDLFAGEIGDQTFVKVEFPVKPVTASRRRIAAE